MVAVAETAAMGVGEGAMIQQVEGGHTTNQIQGATSMSEVAIPPPIEVELVRELPTALCPKVKAGQVVLPMALCRQQVVDTAYHRLKIAEALLLEATVTANPDTDFLSKTNSE